MIFTKTSLPEVYIIETEPNIDERGFFSRTFCKEEFAAIGFHENVVQINHSMTREKGTIRGLHFQYPPHEETKIIRCLSGEIFDVAVDIRKDSPTFLKWHGEIISAENRKGLLIPKGFAHGFQTLKKNCELLYLHSELYCAEAQGVINCNDPSIGITWPIPVTLMSERDKIHPYLAPEFEGIIL